jgi:hypothetical protein
LGGALLGYAAIWFATPCCGQGYQLPPPNSLGGLALLVAGLWIVLGTLGVIGVLPPEAGGDKIKWSAGVAALAWAIPFLFLVSVATRPPSGAPNPVAGIERVFLVAIVPAAIISAIALWFLLFLGDLIRHRLRRSRAAP